MSNMKSEKFKRLAKQRGEKTLNSIHLLGNLSNTNNYSYTDQDVKRLFGAIEEELRATRALFGKRNKREINL